VLQSSADYTSSLGARLLVGKGGLHELLQHKLEAAVPSRAAGLTAFKELLPHCSEFEQGLLSMHYYSSTDSSHRQNSSAASSLSR
jgi:hypothetical protein